MSDGMVKGVENYGPENWCAIHRNHYSGGKCPTCFSGSVTAPKHPNECSHGYLYDLATHRTECPQCGEYKQYLDKVLSGKTPQEETAHISAPSSVNVPATDAAQKAYPGYLMGCVMYHLKAASLAPIGKDKEDLKMAAWYLQKEIGDA